MVNPRVVVTLGNFATKLLLGTTEGITKLRGRSYPLGGRVLVPTFHPAAVLRGGGETVAQMRADLVRAKQLVGRDTIEPAPSPASAPALAPPQVPAELEQLFR
jgi:DNA polymerase